MTIIISLNKQINIGFIEKIAYESIDLLVLVKAESTTLSLPILSKLWLLCSSLTHTNQFTINNCNLRYGYQSQSANNGDNLLPSVPFRNLKSMDLVGLVYFSTTQSVTKFISSFSEDCLENARNISGNYLDKSHFPVPKTRIILFISFV